MEALNKSLRIEKLNARDVEHLSMQESQTTNTGWTASQLSSSVESDHHCYKLRYESTIVGYGVIRVIGVELELLN